MFRATCDLAPQRPHPAGFWLAGLAILLLTSCLGGQPPEAVPPDAETMPQESKPAPQPAPPPLEEHALPETRALPERPAPRPPGDDARAALPTAPPVAATPQAPEQSARRQRAIQRSPGQATAPSPGTQAETSQEDLLAAVDRALESMVSANIAFNTPQTLNISESAKIRLLLSLQATTAELQQELAQTGPSEGARIKVSNRMEARLTGANFQITANSSEEQAVGHLDTVEWQWEIKPLAKGPQNLHLTLTAIIDVNGKSTRKSIRTFDRIIQIQVTPRQAVSGFIAKNWQWLWAAILLPVLGWFWKRFSGSRSGRSGGR